MEVAREHGFTEMGQGVEIMDEFGEFKISVHNVKHLQYDLIGEGFKKYGAIVNLAHGKGHAMGGYSYSLEVEDITDDYKNNGNILLENRNLIKVYEIDIKNDNKIIPMKNGEYVIKIKLDNDVKKYDNYMVAFIENDTVKEQFETTRTSNELQFKTTHLSKYAIYGYNASKEEKKLENNNSKKDNKSYFWISIIMGTLVIVVILITIIIKIKKKKSV